MAQNITSSLLFSSTNRRSFGEWLTGCSRRLFSIHAHCESAFMVGFFWWQGYVFVFVAVTANLWQNHNFLLLDVFHSGQKSNLFYSGCRTSSGHSWSTELAVGVQVRKRKCNQVSQTELCPNSSSIALNDTRTYHLETKAITRMTVSFGNKAVKPKTANFFLLTAAWVCPGRSALQSAEQGCQRRYGHKHQIMWYIKTYGKKRMDLIEQEASVH